MGRHKRKWTPPKNQPAAIVKTAHTPAPPKAASTPVRPKDIVTAATLPFVRTVHRSGQYEIDYARLLDYTELLPPEAQSTYRDAVYALADQGVTHSCKALDHPVHAIDFVLVWMNTPQGHDYWQDLAANLENSPLQSHFTT